MAILELPFSCRKGNMVIRGKEIFDDSLEGRLTPVIISHGFTADMRSTLPYGQFLAGLGFHAYVYDFCGGGYETTSDGSFNDSMTPLTEVDDLKSVISYVSGQGGIDMRKLVLMGCSQGGFVSALAAAGLKDKVNGLVLFYPALCIPDDARAGKMQRIRFDPDNIPPVIGTDRMMVAGAYASSVIRMNIFEEIRPYKGKVLIVHGTGDAIVNYGYALVADEIYRKNDADSELFLLANAPHGFRDENFEEACEILKTWIEKL